MNFTTTTTQLKAAVSLLGPVIPSNTMLPIYEDICFLSNGDDAIMLAKGGNPEEMRVSDIMTSIQSMDRFLPIEEANQFMHKNKIRHLAITEDNKIVGILSIKDLVAYYSRDFRMQE